VAKPTVLRQLIELIPAYLVPRAMRWQRQDPAQLLRRDGSAVVGDRRYGHREKL